MLLPWVRVQVFAYAALLAVFSLSISLDAVNRQAGADGPPDLGLVNGTTAAACAPLPNATLSDALAAAASCAHADWAASACAGLAAGGWRGADACAWAASHVGAALQPAVEVRCAALCAHTRAPSLPPCPRAQGARGVLALFRARISRGGPAPAAGLPWSGWAQGLLVILLVSHVWGEWVELVTQGCTYTKLGWLCLPFPHYLSSAWNWCALEYPRVP